MAMNTLANLRKLSRPINVEIHQTSTVPQATPIIAGPINGDQPTMIGVPAARLNGVAKPNNGVNRINGKLNGHDNRFRELLEPTTTN